MKTYIVSNLTEAVEKIKKDLGPKAVILSTKKADLRSSFMHFGKPRLEVTAALDVDVNHPAYLQPTIASSVNQAVRNASQINDDKLTALKNELDEIKASIRMIYQNSQLTSPAPMEQVKSEPKAVLATTAIKTEDKLSQVNVTQGNNDGVESEIVKLCSQLLKHRVNPQFVQALADHLIDKKIDITNETLRDEALDYLFEQIPDTLNYLNLEGDQKILCFVGPTGAGKTTSLAKIAALLMSHSKKVGIISMDYFRIGGHEQLEKYAKIMRMDALKVTSTDELKGAITHLQDCDYILLDTSGVSSRDQESIKTLNGMLNDSGKSITRTLVLPVSLQEPDLSNVTASYSTLNPSNIIITKLDESISFGSMLNATLSTKLPLAYFALGQEVPEDIEEASKERILDCILNISGQMDIDQTYEDSKVDKVSIQTEGATIR
ncbi:flagellar biosynthesis protein FlhF [bacterium]|nr:flagellar biosynthesis protein FlhF [bacterium]